MLLKENNNNYPNQSQIYKLYEEAQCIGSLGHWHWNIVDNSIQWSSQIYDIFGKTKETFHLNYSSFLKCVHPDDRSIVKESIKKAISGDSEYDITHRIILSDKSMRYVKETGKVFFDSKQQPSVMTGTVQDVTDLIEIQSENILYKQLTNNVTDSIIIAHPKTGFIVDCNDSTCKTLGYKKEELLKLPIWTIEKSFVNEEDWQKHVTAVHQERKYFGEGEHIKKDGSVIPVEVSVNSLKGKTKYIVAICRDISERKEREKELKKYQNDLEELVDNRTSELQTLNYQMFKYVSMMNEHVLYSKTNLEGIITYASHAFCLKCGYTQDELIGKPHSIVRHPDTEPDLYKVMWDSLLEGKSWSGELRNKTKDGFDYWVYAHIYPDKNQDGEIVGYCSIRHDITDQKKIEDIARLDHLTNLYNRRYFQKIMSEEIRRCAWNGLYLGFAIFDVDYFKAYNDTYGHMAGDEALISISQNLREQLKRITDYAFRLGGEEFAILFVHNDKKKIISHAKKIRKSMTDLKIEHSKSDASKYLSVSMGLIIAHADLQLDVKDFYSAADRLLYLSKKKGRNRTEHMVYQDKIKYNS